MACKSVFLLLLSLLLSGCSALEADNPPEPNDPIERSQNFQPSEQMSFNDQIFQLCKTSDLVEMVRYVYNPRGKNSAREKIVLFFDRNLADLSLEQRLALRQKSYQRNENTLAEMTISDDTLYSQLVYHPSQQFVDWGVELAKGKNLAKCGFFEFQYSYAVKTNTAAKQNESAFLAQHIYPKAQQMLQQLQQQPWLWQCD